MMFETVGQEVVVVAPSSGGGGSSTSVGHVFSSVYDYDPVGLRNLLESRPSFHIGDLLRLTNLDFVGLEISGGGYVSEADAGAASVEEAGDGNSNRPIFTPVDIDGDTVKDKDFYQDSAGNKYKLTTAKNADGTVSQFLHRITGSITVNMSNPESIEFKLGIDGKFPSGSVGGSVTSSRGVSSVTYDVNNPIRVVPVRP